MRGVELDIHAHSRIVIESWPKLRVTEPNGPARGGTLELRLGNDTWIGEAMTLELEAGRVNRLEIGPESLLGDNVRIVLRGGSVRTGRQCNIRDGAWIKSDGFLSIGDEVQVGQGGALHCAYELSVGSRSVLAERVSALDSDHTFSANARHFRDNPLTVEATDIGENCLAGAGAVILRGCRIGKNSVIGANAVVLGGDYPAESMLVGNPATQVQATAMPGAGAPSED